MKKETLLVITFWLMIGSLGLNLLSNDKALGATPLLRPFQGGTGTGTAPSYGQVLVGDSSGIYTLMSTSSLNITGGSASWSTLGYPFPSNATTSVLTFTNGLLAGTSTFLGATTTFEGAIVQKNNSHITTHGVVADGSDGLHFDSTGGPVLLIGAGGGLNSTFNNGVNVTGVLAANGGLTFTQATGTNVYASASSTFQVLNAGTLTMPSLTLGSLAVNSSGLVYKAATTTFSTGLTYSNGNVTADLGTSVDLAAEVTGTLPYGNGGTGATSYTTGNLVYAGPTSFQTVATGTVSATSPVTVTASRYVIGGAATIAWDFSVSNTWTGKQTFDGATTTALTASSFFQLPNGATQAPTLAGACAYDTTANQLKCGDGSAGHVYNRTWMPSTVAASTTPDAAYHKFTATASSSFLVATYPSLVTLNRFYCTASSTGGALARFGDGTNWTTYAVCKPNVPGAATSLSNNTFTSLETIYVEIGSATSTVPSYVTVTGEFEETLQ